MHGTTEEVCPQCGRASNDSTNRLVVDSCGHQKCRGCLLQDEERCQQCETKPQEQAPSSVIKFENNHTPVIICNGTANIDKPTLPDESCEEKISKRIEEIVKATIKKSGRVRAKKDKNRQNGGGKLKKPYQKIIIPGHIEMVQDPLRYKCSICGKQFLTKDHIKYHLYCVAETTKPHRCGICTKDFITKTHLNLHLLKHSGTRPFACQVCQKSFVSKHKLSRHSLLHESRKRFVCSECGKAFRTKDSLNIHSLTHRGEKPYVCKVCGVGFSNASNLNRHLMTHSKERVHMCDKCGKKFKLKSALNLHRRFHLGIRPNECSTCFRTFVDGKDLQRHQLSHLDIKAYTCSICTTSFRRKDNLHRHVKNAHPGKKIEPVLCTVKQLITKLPPALPPPQPPPPSLLTPVAPSLLSPSNISTTHIGRPLVDNPNAINVIMASPNCKNNNSVIDTNGNNHGDRNDAEITLPNVNGMAHRQGTVINVPAKLKFKSTYNFNRNCDVYPKSYDPAESVNICQKILAPHSPPPLAAPAPMLQLSSVGPQSPKNVISFNNNDDNNDSDVAKPSSVLDEHLQETPTTSSNEASTKICQNILSLNPPTKPLHYETSFEHRKHAIIKNIKFKLPANYTNLRMQDTFKDLTPLQPVTNVNLDRESTLMHQQSQNNSYTELKTVSLSSNSNNNNNDSVMTTTSVIVNSGVNQLQQPPLDVASSNMHWRRRTSQNLAMKILEN